MRKHFFKVCKSTKRGREGMNSSCHLPQRENCLRTFSHNISSFFFFLPPPTEFPSAMCTFFSFHSESALQRFGKALWHPEGRSEDCRAPELREDSSGPALDVKRRPTFLTFLSVASSLAGIAAAVSASSSSSSIGLLLPLKNTHRSNVPFPPCLSHYNSSGSSFPGGENAECGIFTLPLQHSQARLCFCGVTRTPPGMSHPGLRCLDTGSDPKRNVSFPGSVSRFFLRPTGCTVGQFQVQTGA